MSVDVVCFQELSAYWRTFLSQECFGVGWTKMFDTSMNVLTAIRTSAVTGMIAESILCFPDPADRTSKHRWWRRALETAFLCSRSGRLMSVVNLHIISGSRDDEKKSSVVPGDNSAARERFKMLAFKNTLVQAHKRLGGMERDRFQI